MMTTSKTSSIIAAIIGIGLLATAALVLPLGNIFSSAFAQQQQQRTNPNNNAASTDCNRIAGQLSAKAMSNGNVCSIFIVRKSPTVMSHDGMPLNNFVVASNLLEIAPMTTAATATSLTNNNNSNVMVMGEFALLEPELVPVKKVLDERVNVTAVHNHMVMESPKLINIHWEARGNLGTAIQIVQQALAQTSILSAASSSSSTSTSMNNTTSIPSSSLTAPSGNSTNQTTSFGPQGAAGVGGNR